MNYPLKANDTVDAMRALFVLFTQQLGRLTDGAQQLRLAKTMHRFLRLMMNYKRHLIGRARRAAVLACPKLREAAYLAIGLMAILRWEDAWHRRHDLIKRRGRRDTPRNTPTASPAQNAPDYALMPHEPRDYGYEREERPEAAMSFEIYNWADRPLPPAYVYPHEICARPDIRAGQGRLYNADKDDIKDNDYLTEFIDNYTGEDLLEAYIRDGPDGSYYDP